jgi:hypothetical protein
LGRLLQARQGQLLLSFLAWCSETRERPWEGAGVAGLADKYAPLIEIRRLSGERQPGVLLADGDVFTRLGLLRSDEAAQYLA